MLTISDFIKYVIEGLAVSVAAYLVAGRKSNISEILLLGLTAGVTFMILDLFTQGIGYSARQGAGFGIGVKQVGFLGGNTGIAPFLGEGFESGTDVAAKQPNYRNITMGVDSYGDTIGYDPETHEYGRQDTDKTAEPVINYMGEIPYRFPNVYKSTCPQQPVPGTPVTSPYGITRTGSRWMGWVENDRK